MGMSLVFLLVGLVVGALLGYVGAVARRASQPGDDVVALRAQVARWQARAEELSRRVESAEARSQGDASVLQALAPVRAQLEQMTQRVDQMEQTRARQHGALAEQLRESAQREVELARTTASLEGALRSRSARGTWGEVELARILEAAGMMPHVDFAEQRSVGSLTQGRGLGAESASGERGRPDVTIHLPGQGFLALDAKAPMDAYLRACGIEESGEMAEARRCSELAAHAKALRSHVEALASRDYARLLGSSPELVILFVPSEAALSAALRADASLLDDAMARGVALCSPVTLLAVAHVRDRVGTHEHQRASGPDHRAGPRPVRAARRRREPHGEPGQELGAQRGLLQQGCLLHGEPALVPGALRERPRGSVEEDHDSP